MLFGTLAASLLGNMLIEKKIFGDFFRYDVIQEMAWFKAFLTPIFNKFFRTAFKQLENQTLKISSQFNK